MMPTSQTQAYTSGHAGVLWNAHKHKKAQLLGITVDNKHTAPVTIKLYDCFTTDESKTGSTGATQAAEDLGTTNVLSGKIRLPITVPAGETVKLGEQDCKGVEFLGKVTAIASAESADCIIVAQYSMN
jgi:hypothetical protein